MSVKRPPSPGLIEARIGLCLLAPRSYILPPKAYTSIDLKISFLVFNDYEAKISPSQFSRNNKLKLLTRSFFNDPSKSLTITIFNDNKTPVYIDPATHLAEIISFDPPRGYTFPHLQEVVEDWGDCTPVKKPVRVEPCFHPCTKLWHHPYGLNACRVSKPQL
jgi:hypothetical protein